MVIAIIGISYAAFNYSGLGTKVNTITTGAIKMTYTEDDNIISMSGALPTTDATGKVRLNDGEYFDFTVSSEISGNTNINYEISAKDVTTSERKIDGSNIKLYLTKLTDSGEEELMTPETYNEEASANDYTGRLANEMSLYTSSMNSSESNRYRLRMWVDEEYNPQGDGGNLSFSVRVNVYGKDRTAEPVSDVLLANIPEENQYDDGVDTFITGEDPNNYIWYSGKLWRAVLTNNKTKTVKLVTQWNITTVPYNDNSTDFEGSHMEEWLNDTTVDGFLGNLRESDKFIVIDAVWDATMDDRELGSITRPNGTTTVTDTVGLLNMYEYQESFRGTDYSNGYLNNGLTWWTLTPNDVSSVYRILYSGNMYTSSPGAVVGVRPSINLKSDVKIVSGSGKKNDPYRLEGDNDKDLLGTMLNTRYSGEYIRFGNDENNLYRIVSHETEGLTKITSAEPLKSGESFISSAFNSSRNVNYSNKNTIGTFLNGEYLTNYVGSNYSNTIEDSTTWYLGTVGGGTSYRLAKYVDTSMSSYATSTDAKVGLLRIGELMSGQFERNALKGSDTISNLTFNYWVLTPYSTSGIHYIYGDSFSGSSESIADFGIKPSLNLKSNVVITGGNGTKNSPFQIALN